MLQPDDDLYDEIFSLIQKDKTLTDKKQLLEDMFIINDECVATTKRLASYERLITYLSNLPKWEEALITYMGNRFAQSKGRK